MNAAALAHHADIGIGRTTVRLHCADGEFLESLGARYTGFLAPAGPPDYEFDIQLAQPDPDTIDDDVAVSRRDGLWCLRRGDFHAEWDPASRRGWIRQPPNPYSLDSVLRIVHTLLLAGTGGMLVHSSSAVRNGRAYLFAGVSGAGKTTMARLAPPDVQVLTDEMSYVSREADGYFAYGTPFAGDLARPGENVRAPLGGIFLLHQGPENRIDAVGDADAVRGLLANILFFAHDPDLVNAVFADAIELVARVPVRRLTFLPDARVWDLIGN
jgi:hypothetical protein